MQSHYRVTPLQFSNFLSTRLCLWHLTSPFKFVKTRMLGSIALCLASPTAHWRKFMLKIARAAQKSCWGGESYGQITGRTDDIVEWQVESRFSSKEPQKKRESKLNKQLSVVNCKIKLECLAALCSMCSEISVWEGGCHTGCLQNSSVTLRFA